MDLLQAIHSRWAATPALVGAIPAARFTTGAAPPETALPYATCQLLSAAPLVSTAIGQSVARARFGIAIRGEALAMVRSTLKAAEAAFTETSLGSDAEIACVWRTSRVREERHGVWLAAAEFELLALRDAGS